MLSDLNPRCFRARPFGSQGGAQTEPGPPAPICLSVAGELGAMVNSLREGWGRQRLQEGLRSDQPSRRPHRQKSRNWVGGLPFHRLAMVRGLACHGGIGRTMTVLNGNENGPPVSAPAKGYDFFFLEFIFFFFFGLGGLGHSFCFCGATPTVIHQGASVPREQIY